MVKLLGNAWRLNQAFQLVEDLSSQNGFRPNVQVYTCLTQACVMNRRLDRELQLHDRMVADTRCAIDGKFHSVLVRRCIQLRQLLTEVDVVRAAYHLPGGSLSSRFTSNGHGASHPEGTGEEAEDIQPGGLHGCVDLYN